MGFGFDDIFDFDNLFSFSGMIRILLIIFWIWMIVDVAQRKFRNSVEKIIWIVVVVIGFIVGAFVYFIVVRMYNPKGLVKK